MQFLHPPAGDAVDETGEETADEDKQLALEGEGHFLLAALDGVERQAGGLGGGHAAEVIDLQLALPLDHVLREVGLR